MAKNKSTDDGYDQFNSDYPVESEDKFEQSKPEETRKYPSKSKEIFLVHKRNTKKELHIGRKVYTFNGHEKVEVPVEVINHSDFKGQEKYFLIKEK